MTMTTKKSLAAALAALPLLFVASCGTVDSREGATDAQLEEWKSQPANARFTAQEIAAVYSTATKVVNGKTFPDSKAPTKAIYTYANAPAAFKAEHGVFTSAAEIKGYLNLGYLPVTGFQQRYVSNFEKVSTWKTIPDPKGGFLFADAFTTDAGGRKIADWSDGYAAATGEVHYASLSLKTNTPLGAIAVPSTVTIYNRGGEIQLDVTNPRDVRAPIVGTVIKANGLKIHLKAFPYQKGWLVYGTAVVKLEKFEDAIKPETLSGYVDSLFGWVKDNTVLALN